jgi:O-antigen/teichoic acid export membrane protein
MRYLLVCSLPIAIGCFVFAPDLIPFLFGAQYSGSLLVLQIIVWVVPFMYMSEFLGYTVVIQGEERKVARSVVISTTINVLCNLLLVPVFGHIGAAIMTVATEVVLVGQYMWLLRDAMLQINWKRSFFQPFLAAAVMGVLAFAARPYLPFLINAIIAGGIYLALLVSMNVVGKDELRFMRSLRSSSEATPAS